VTRKISGLPHVAAIDTTKKLPESISANQSRLVQRTILPGRRPKLTRVRKNGRSCGGARSRSGEASFMAVVLVVEDEERVRLMLADILRSINHEVRLACTAADGISIFQGEDLDLVLLDILLPDSSGTGTLDQMRELRSKVPVIVMSGHADDEVTQQMLRRGAFNCIAKPFKVEQLLRVVHAALAFHQQPSQ
jgi:CheY-like chemotaxis protein